jgi:hypothetical protein
LLDEGAEGARGGRMRRREASSIGEEEGEACRRKKMGLTGGPHMSAGGRERRRGRWWSGPCGPEVGSWAAAESEGPIRRPERGGVNGSR